MNEINNPLAWDLDAEPNKDLLIKKQTEQYEIDSYYFNCFNTPDGKKVLEHLVKNTRDAGTWLPSLAINHGMEAAMAHGFAREGQNALIQGIQDRIERGRTGINKPKEKKNVRGK